MCISAKFSIYPFFSLLLPPTYVSVGNSSIIYAWRAGSAQAALKRIRSIQDAHLLGLFTQRCCENGIQIFSVMAPPSLQHSISPKHTRCVALVVLLLQVLPLLCKHDEIERCKTGNQKEDGQLNL